MSAIELEWSRPTDGLPMAVREWAWEKLQDQVHDLRAAAAQLRERIPTMTMISATPPLLL